jgi:uncharacterized protein with PQ loop repeat
VYSVYARHCVCVGRWCKELYIHVHVFAHNVSIAVSIVSSASFVYWSMSVVCVCVCVCQHLRERHTAHVHRQSASSATQRGHGLLWQQTLPIHLWNGIVCTLTIFVSLKKVRNGTHIFSANYKKHKQCSYLLNIMTCSISTLAETGW